MGTEIATRVQYPPATPELSKSMSQQALHDHRAGIASEVRVVLSAYFQPSEASEIRAAQLAWWCDELQDWTREQVVWGLRQWNRENPDKRPTPGHILGIMKDMRGRREAKRISALPKPAEPERIILTTEERTALAASLGLPEVKAKSFPQQGGAV